MVGLTSAEAARRLAEVGPNELPSHRRRCLARLVLDIVREPMLLLLLTATAIYLVFGDLAETLTLATFVVVVMTIELVQERRTEAALEALRELASPIARVLRDGSWRQLDARVLVPGDTIQLVEGERVPADARLVDGALLSVDESLLTGESAPVTRDPGRRDPVFAGTLVTSGHGIAEVTATGGRSEMGRIGVGLGTLDVLRAPVQREVARLVPRIAIVAIALALLLVVVRGLTEGRWLAAALSGITLAMSLLPEEMPIVLTVFFAVGARRISHHGVLARRAAAVEALGAITVLCVDKTGTLTENRMSIARLATLDTDLAVDGAGELPESVHRLVEFGLLACPRDPADPMDRAFAALVHRTLEETEHVHPGWAHLREYPLRTGLLAVTHTWKGDHTHMVVATKGAPEAIIDLCHLSGEAAAPWRALTERMARDGLRVLGVAQATFRGAAPPDNPHDYEFEIAGLVGLADPVRADSPDMVARCRAAGIRVLMLTGDHPDTALAIARAAGIASGGVLTGTELDTLDDDALARRLARTDVIARAVPAHKLRIVRALRSAGEVVGMTGDGVNDAPALAAADIGIAMGGRGSDVAREAAGLVLVEDDLRSIVLAVRTGRAIYDNIRASVGYLLGVHIPIAGLALVPPLFGWGALLAPVHIAFLELMIGPTCSIVFEMEPPAPDIMERPPRPRAARMLDRRRVATSIAMGALALAGGASALAWAHATGLPAPEMSALAFVALIGSNTAALVAIRTQPLRANPGAMIVIAAALGLGGLAVTVLPGLFEFATPPIAALTLSLAAGILPVLLVPRPRRTSSCELPARCDRRDG